MAKIFLANSFSSLISIKNPFVLSSISSLCPRLIVTTHGMPQTIASTTFKGNPSCLAVETAKFELFINFDISVRYPKNAIAFNNIPWFFLFDNSAG